MPLFARALFALLFVVMPLVAFAPSFFLAGRWSSLLFVSIFFVAGCAIVFASFWAVPLSALFYLMLVGAAEWLLRRQKGWRDTRADVREVLRENEGRTVEVRLGGFTFTAGGITSGGGSGGGFSGGSSGGFSGGGASGGW